MLIIAPSPMEVHSFVGFYLLPASETSLWGQGDLSGGAILLGERETALDIDLDTRQVDGLHHVAQFLAGSDVGNVQLFDADVLEIQQGQATWE
mgnify:CR=1 FL=1